MAERTKTIQTTLARADALLRQSRHRIIKARLVCLLLGWLHTCTIVFAITAGVFMALRLTSWLFGILEPEPVFVTSSFFAICAILFVLRLAEALRGETIQIDVDEAAERLDLAQATHNRIATAISLLRSGNDSPFARAAVEDGLEHLQRLQEEKPQIETPSPSWRQAGLCLSVGSLMFFFGLLLNSKQLMLDDRQAGQAVAVADSTVAASSSALFEGSEIVQPDPVLSGENRGGEPRTQEQQNTEASEQDESRPPSSDSRSAGAMASYNSGESRSSRTFSNSSGAAEGEGAESKPRDSGPAKPPKPREPKQQVASKQPEANPQNNEKAGSIDASGSSGADATQTSQNEWSSNVKAKADEGDEFQEETEIDEEMDPKKQRLAAQPSLKNRSAQVSRELTVATGTDSLNKQNRGRSGPGQQKKSRGTATMVMGVPIPGFLRGRLLPGPSKSTQEEVEPTARTGDYFSTGAQSQASYEEAPQERYLPVAADSTRARDYLLNYHSKHDSTHELSYDE